ncbi:glyoxalase family protein [Aspergillus arachidicola]|uniref:Glyoxalase family protein n=1 Tax=Aspergillus arachidicola TaxID=656916 RepID=A0A2G7GBD7_9EURO|nr:glyoxalase family protein [Aspergillus arachidicola]
MPVSHLTLTVSHLPTSTSFFLSCLQPLGYQFIGRHDDYIGFGQNPGEPADFWITEQKPGVPAGAAHVAFPAPSKDAVGQFFIHALKAGGKIHGEPKTRDSESGYYSAAIIDVDGNSIEAVYRPSSSSARSEVSRSALALLENGSAVSKTAPSIVSKATSKASSVKPESVAPPRSEARSYVSKATTAVERAAPSVISREVQPAPSPTYVVHHTTQKTDDGKAAKTIVGTLIGAAAGAAIAYAMSKGDSEPSETTPPPQYTPRDFAQLISPSQAQSPSQELQGFRAIEAPPARSVYSHSEVRPTLTRSVTSKNPRASTIYEGSEFIPRGGGGSVYLDQNGRRASEGSVYSGSDYPIRAIEYPPSVDSRGYEATLISSSMTSHERWTTEVCIHHRQSGLPKPTIKTITLHTARTTRRIILLVILPAIQLQDLIPVALRSGAKSGVSARNIPLPESVYDDVDVETNVTPDDSISQVDDSRRSSVSHRSHASKAASRISKHSSKFDEPVKPSDSVSQVSSHASRASQRTIKAGGSVAGGSKAPSKASLHDRTSNILLHPIPGPRTNPRALGYMLIT